jgi:hypothetical protein
MMAEHGVGQVSVLTGLTWVLTLHDREAPADACD